MVPRWWCISTWFFLLFAHFVIWFICWCRSRCEWLLQNRRRKILSPLAYNFFLSCSLLISFVHSITNNIPNWISVSSSNDRLWCRRHERKKSTVILIPTSARFFFFSTNQLTFVFSFYGADFSYLSMKCVNFFLRSNLGIVAADNFNQTLILFNFKWNSRSLSRNACWILDSMCQKFARNI